MPPKWTCSEISTIYHYRYDNSNDNIRCHACGVIVVAGLPGSGRGRGCVRECAHAAARAVARARAATRRRPSASTRAPCRWAEVCAPPLPSPSRDPRGSPRVPAETNRGTYRLSVDAYKIDLFYTWQTNDYTLPNDKLKVESKQRSSIETITSLVNFILPSFKIGDLKRIRA